MRIKSKILSLVIAASILSGITACQASGSSLAETATTLADASTTKISESHATVGSEQTTPETVAEKGAPAMRKIIDMGGAEVEIPDKVERVVVIGMYPLPSMIANYLGSGKKVVGMDEFAHAAAKNGLLGKIHPDILDATTSFMDSDNVNIESLLELKPDVVFVAAANKKLTAKLQEAGLHPVGVVAQGNQYNCIETYNDWFKLLNAVFPNEGPSEDKITSYSKEIFDLVQSRVKDIPEAERVRALYIFRYNDKELMISGENFFGNWWIKTSGGINVAAEVKENAAQPATMEQIYTWNPDVIFLTNFSSSLPEDLYNNAINQHDWSPVKAVQEKRVYKMPLASYRTYTPGVDTPVTMLWVAKSMYPDKFEDIDIGERFKTYYKDFFNVELTEEDISNILNPPREAAGKH